MSDTFFSAAPHWTWFIIPYFFIGGLAGGAYFLAAFLEWFGQPADRPVIRTGYRVAAVGAILSGVLLTIDLGRPLRFWHMLFQSENFPTIMFKTWSPISFGAWLILLFGLFSVLSALGVNIGPLLAGAGIVGLAIGFGAQTLVRDIITGAFLIMDDAFRVGEYIQSGNYKGTVESIGLRSLKLRHHRGPIYVVPFGELRGVQNVSRDWVITKLTVGITYDSDLDKAKKLVKKIGQELAADPEFKDEILVPLKMQGVEEFGDFAIQIRMKVMTKPGEKQFMIRRRAFAMIKKSFDANGVKFAFPTVQIAGGGDAAVAAAATRLPSISGEHAA